MMMIGARCSLLRLPLHLNLSPSPVNWSLDSVRWFCSCRSGLQVNSGSSKGSKDGDNRLIYEGPLISKVKSVKLLSLTTSVAGLAAQMVIYSKSLQEGSNISTLTLIISSTMVLLFSFTPLLIHSITKRYVYKLYFDPDEKIFTAYTLNFINQPVVTQFNKSSLQLAPVASPFTTMMVDNKPFFVDIKEIKDPDALEMFIRENIQ